MPEQNVRRLDVQLGDHVRLLGYRTSSSTVLARVGFLGLFYFIIDEPPGRRYNVFTSTLAVYTIGPYAAEVKGRVIFESDYVLDVWELLDLSTRTIRSRFS